MDKYHEHGMRHIFMISFNLICMNMFIYFAFILLTKWNKTILFLCLGSHEFGSGAIQFSIVT